MKINTNAAASQTQIMRQFVESVDDGNVCRELSEDCILNILGRCYRGFADVTGYMRTQIAGRYKHVNFENAGLCDSSQEVILNSRFGRSFELLRRRLKAKRNKVVSMLARKAESDDDSDDVEKGSNQLATPPRSNLQVQDVQSLQYIQSIGLLEAHHEDDDGGISFENPCKVKLTLGYRCGESTTEICLVLYEKLNIPATTGTPGRPRTRYLRPGYVHTDDEGEEPAPRKVRRALFSTVDSDEDSPKPCLTPLKRQHKMEPSKNSKRSMRF